MSARPLYRMPYDGKHVPHLVIEVNQRCNIRCTACYKHKDGETKPLETVLGEIDLALQRRDLRAITLAGGEPTLHPDLPAIIKYIDSRGVQAQMLTNGYKLSDDLLGRLHEAGLKELFLHIDSFQDRPDLRRGRGEKELNDLREQIAKRVVANGIHCSLVLTLYRATLNDLPGVVRFTLTNPYITRLLVTCYTDFDRIGREFRGGDILGTLHGPGARRPLAMSGDSLAEEAVTSREVEALLRKELGMAPFGYVASSHNLTEPRWLFYYSLAQHQPGKPTRLLHIAPTFDRAVRLVYGLARLRGNPYSFADVLSQRQSLTIALVNALVSASPSTVRETMAFLAGMLRKGSSIQHKSFTFQQGPNLTADGAIEYCRDCPDATIRDGVLVPVCLVDVVRPKAAQAS
ncbi:MAG: radical SAM protein [Deltaproteobacteria bacterium]|nr:radical SAM protein [Deltaproteobacteria bacterium]